MYSATVIGPVAKIFVDNCFDNDSIDFKSTDDFGFSFGGCAFVNDGRLIGLYEQFLVIELFKRFPVKALRNNILSDDKNINKLLKWGYATPWLIRHWQYFE